MLSTAVASEAETTDVTEKERRERIMVGITDALDHAGLPTDARPMVVEIRHTNHRDRSDVHHEIPGGRTRVNTCTPA
jgi:hypothetical protein